MSGGQEKNFSTLGPKLRGNKAQQDYGDKQRQICIEVIHYKHELYTSSQLIVMFQMFTDQIFLSRAGRLCQSKLVS